MVRLSTCKKLKQGLKTCISDENIVNNFLQQGEHSLLRTEKLIEENDMLWAPVTLYYSIYYAMYAFLQKLGSSCENHACSILVFKIITEHNDVFNDINEFKKLRIDSQYFLKLPLKDTLEKAFKKAKNNYNIIYNLCHLGEGQLSIYKKKKDEIFESE